MVRTIEFTETVLRDAHQSLMATRMRTSDFKDALNLLDNAGYRALECWGGATFDSCIRFLDEDPWERLRFIKSNLKNTKTQMLLRGQNLLGYKNYPDDVVEKFIELSISNGIDIVRIFDALNDLRNLQTSIQATKKYGAEAQVAISYTTSEVHTVEYFANLVSKITEMGADSIAIKDMAGILTPYKAFELVTELKKNTNLPLELHTHETTGMGSMTYLKGIEAGIDIIDTAISPFSGGTSQPSTETLDVLIRESGNNTRLNMKVLEELASFFQKVKEKYIAEGTLPTKMLSIDPKGLIYQVPGGMLSNLYTQLSGLKKLDKYEEVLQEVPRVRADLGFPPLVTPMSQMVGTQATFNIITGQRYKMVPNEVKDYLKGLYGQTPVPVDEAFRKSIIQDAEVITDRPANHLSDGLPKIIEEIADVAQSQEDVLTYALFPEVGKSFLERKYNL
ncbi:oxaloacetate decarboxylase, alpha subunit [Peptoniphilus asaccharolyticus DSM 20463]|uniref:Oxaloacetate decarboxylase, alpha subunit n=1 Tax=Peptoniphilus asaccharolyticus DSM 20463 TaxID=573058 RepID=A0A1W1UNR9_PEPAS|nr:oxaloacetate decarboxylase subunit alpha [Peptoniphilus asaccharolyticus]MBL7574970.1 oxaloacetate decarboxylase subunit alpha [Peptoniphilus asaccharolyticus]SMB82720.1 oxaloacetate decarboxylase, alpha subunit [Peptoniphilus asaccharolyticus DSM 20463]